MGAARLAEVDLPDFGMPDEAPQIPADVYRARLERLRARMDEHGYDRIVDLMQPLADRLGCRFVGIDFSLAPFPVQERSIGAAFERLGVDCFGAPGTLFVASLLTDSLRRAQGQPCGFNGLMLSVLEDAVLTARSQEKTWMVLLVAISGLRAYQRPSRTA